MTAYVIYGLSLARASDVKVDENMYQRGVAALEVLLEGKATQAHGGGEEDPNARAYMLFSLSQAKKLEKKQLAKPYKDRAKLSSYGKAVLARAHARRRWDGAETPAHAVLYRLCRAAVFTPILNKLGFDQLELIVCAGAPLPPETMALWQMLGLNVVEMYGQTETAGGIICGQRGPFARPGDVGTAPLGWQVKLAGDGEVLVKSPDLFEAYWNNPEATRAIKGEDGWLRTGDIGEWCDGALRLVDRARDFIVKDPDGNLLLFAGPAA